MLSDGRTVICLSYLSVLSCLQRWYIVAKRLDGSRCHLISGRPRSRPHCVRWGPSSPPTERGTTAPTFAVYVQTAAHVYCGQTARWLRIALGTEVGLGPGDTVLHGDPAALSFSCACGTDADADGPSSVNRGPCPMSIVEFVAKRSPISATTEHLYHLSPIVAPSPFRTWLKTQLFHKYFSTVACSLLPSLSKTCTRFALLIVFVCFWFCLASLISCFS